MCGGFLLFVRRCILIDSRYPRLSSSNTRSMVSTNDPQLGNEVIPSYRKIWMCLVMSFAFPEI